MGDRELQLAISCCQARLPVAELGCSQLSCWPKGSPGNSQTTQAVAKTRDCSLQINSGASLLGTTHTQLIELGDDELVHNI